MSNQKKEQTKKLKQTKKITGRKLFDGKNEKDIITKLEYVWAIGGSDREASFHADITPMSLSRYLKSHSNVSLRKEGLLNSPNLIARQEVIKGLKGNPELALKYLERKLPHEFSLKYQFEHSGGLELNGTLSIKDFRKSYDNYNPKKKR